MEHHRSARDIHREFKAVMMDSKWRPDMDRPEAREKGEIKNDVSHHQQSRVQ